MQIQAGLENGFEDRSIAWVNETLPGLEGLADVCGVEGEFWSPRKLLRRAAWHERDHIQHIQRLMTLL
jgi:hypothetical protein